MRYVNPDQPRKAVDLIVAVMAMKVLLGSVALALFASAMHSCAPEEVPIWPEETMQKLREDVSDKTYGGDVSEYFGMDWPQHYVY